MTDKLEALSQPAVWTNQQSDEVIKRLMTGLCMQENIMLYQAFKQLENEIVQSAWAALEEKDQCIAELNVKLFDQSILLDAAISRAEASGRREEHLKADVAVLAQRVKELESDVRVADGIIANHQKLNAELEQRLQQPIQLPDLSQSVSGSRYVWSDGVHNYRTDVIAMLKGQGHKVEE